MTNFYETDPEYRALYDLAMNADCAFQDALDTVGLDRYELSHRSKAVQIAKAAKVAADHAKSERLRALRSGQGI